MAKSAIYKKIIKQYESAIKQVAEEVSFQVESAYESVIDMFYNDYTPRWYERTGSTYRASDHVDDMSKITKVGDEYLSGIIVDSENINGNPYRADTDWVFERTFVRGIHGFTAHEGRRFAQKMRQRFKEGKSIHFINMAQLNTQWGNWNEDMKWGNGKKPKDAMDKAFKELTKKKNLDALFQKQFSKI